MERKLSGSIAFFAVFVGLNCLAAMSKSFEDITSQAGISKLNSASVNARDYDGDGKVDLLLGGKLFRNITKNQIISFVDVTSSAGLDGLKGFPLFLDVNNDGLVDIATTSSQLWIQAQAVGTTIVWSAVVSFIAYKLVDMVIGLRVAEDEEREGLDISSHGESAYHS